MHEKDENLPWARRNYKRFKKFMISNEISNKLMRLFSQILYTAPYTRDTVVFVPVLYRFHQVQYYRTVLGIDKFL